MSKDKIDENKKQEEKREHMLVYFKWGGFIKKIEDDSSLMINLFYREFQECAKKNGFDKGVWSQEKNKKEKVGERREGIYYNLHKSEKYGSNKPFIQLSYYSRPEVNTSSSWQVRLAFGKSQGRDKMKSLHKFFDDEKIFDKIKKNNFGNYILEYHELTDSGLNVFFTYGFASEPFEKQYKIILQIWKLLEKYYSEAEKEIKK